MSAIGQRDFRGQPERRAIDDRFELPLLPVCATTQVLQRRRLLVGGEQPHRESQPGAPLRRRDEAAKQPLRHVRTARDTQAVDKRRETWA